MRCPGCDSRNPTGAQTCGSCGHVLAVVCRSCTHINRPGSNYCNACGQLLASLDRSSAEPLSFNQKLKIYQRHLPKGLTEKILAQRDKIEGERKRITVMFCNIAGFTPLVEKLGPEDSYAFMNRVYEILIGPVHRYGGTVNELTGDGIMALFGAPIAVEDAPQRAIRSALAIHREMARGVEGMHRQRRLAPIRMRIGIHTGPVVVGTLGSDLRVEFKAVGNTVNLASRLEALARPGTTYISEDTFKRTEGLFRFEALGLHTIKGKQDPVRVYQVIAAIGRRNRFDARAERGLTPFVGRTQHLNMLLDGFSHAKRGRGRVFSVVGEAGAGKSRLLYEFRKAVSSEDITFIEGRCLSYGRGVSYHPISDLLKAIFDIGEIDGDADIREKVETHLDTLQADKDAIRPYVLGLLSVDEGRIDTLDMSPEARKERTLRALQQILLRGSQQGLLVIAIEDLQWIDSSSVDALDYLLDSIAGARILLILTYRPDLAHAWPDRPHHEQITLPRLTPDESATIVAHLLEVRQVNRILRRLIWEKAEGIPLFIEEMLKTLRDLEMIEAEGGEWRLKEDVPDPAVPATVQEMIMARVDLLPDGAKAVLQKGAVIEREFSYALIRAVAGLAEADLRAHLDLLKASELIDVHGVHPDTVFVFRHALTRDVVYDSILKKSRRRIHATIATTIEQQHADKLNEHYGPLMNHYAASGNHRKVAEYARLASLKAENALALHDAAALALRRVAALEKIDPPQTSPREIVDARTALGFYQFRMSNMAEARDAIAPIEGAFANEDFKPNQGQAWVIIGSYKYMVEEDLDASIRYLEQAVGITEQTGDVITSAYAQYMLGLVRAFNCDYDQAIHYFEALLGLTVAMAFHWRIAVMKSNLSVYGYDYHGKVAQGYRCSREAVDIAEESGDIYSKGMAYPSHGASCYYRGYFGEAERHLLTGVDITARINMSAHNAMAHQYLGHVHFARGRYRQAQHHYRNAIRVRRESRLFPSSVYLNTVALARARVAGGEPDVDLEQICRYAGANRVRVYEGAIARYIAEICLNTGEAARAADWIETAIETDERNHMRCDLGWDHALHAECRRAAGRPADAEASLQKAVSIFQRCGADGWAQRTAERLSTL